MASPRAPRLGFGGRLGALIFLQRLAVAGVAALAAWGAGGGLVVTCTLPP